MTQWSDWMSQAVLGNSLADWAWAGAAFVLTFTVLPLLRSYVGRTARRYPSADRRTAVALLLHLIQNTSRLVLLTVALYAAERLLTLPPRVDKAFDTLIVVSFWAQVGLWALAAVRFGLSRRTEDGHDRQLAGTLSIIMFVVQLVVWGVMLLLALDNLGINITALVAGLGVGGIAIALAVQTILGDLFASLSIALDKPFAVGDLLRVDDCEGNVEQIGIKTTRLRSVTGEQIIISNADLLRSRVRNLGRMSERRALLTLTLDMETTTEQLATVPSLVAAAVAEFAAARYLHCILKEITESGFRHELVFFVPHREGGELNAALDVVNRAIVRRLGSSGIRFAYPTRATRTPANDTR
jgi:small-conductance mechanosensitive channel